MGVLRETMLLCLSFQAHLAIGNLVEPSLFGESFELSPVVVLLSLTFWGSLWVSKTCCCGVCRLCCGCFGCCVCCVALPLMFVLLVLCVLCVLGVLEVLGVLGLELCVADVAWVFYAGCVVCVVLEVYELRVCCGCFGCCGCCVLYVWQQSSGVRRRRRHELWRRKCLALECCRPHRLWLLLPWGWYRCAWCWLLFVLACGSLLFVASPRV